MLVLSRKVGERIQIGSDVCLSITKINGNRVVVGIKAPREMNIRRDELDKKRATEVQSRYFNLEPKQRQ